MARRRAYPSGFPLIPLLIIALGVLLLLQNNGIIPWSIWNTLWRMWPVLLIAIGINIIVGRRSMWLAAGLIALTILAGGGAIILFTDSPAMAHSSSGEVVSEQTPLADAESAALQIDFGAGELTLESLPLDSDNLIEVTSQGRQADISIKHSGSTVEMDISAEDADWHIPHSVSTEWDIALSRDATLDIDINIGAASADLDLRHLRVANLTIDGGAADIEITLPEAASHTHADIDIGAANLVVIIPDGVAARIRTDAPVSSLSIDGRRFPKEDDNVHISPDYRTAENTIDITIDAGVSNIEIP